MGSSPRLDCNPLILYHGTEMNHFLMSRVSAVSPSSSGVAKDPVQRISAMTGVKPSVVRTFAKLSSPQNAQLFTAKAAHKAFQHLKVKA